MSLTILQNAVIANLNICPLFPDAKYTDSLGQIEFLHCSAVLKTKSKTKFYIEFYSSCLESKCCSSCGCYVIYKLLGEINGRNKAVLDDIPFTVLQNIYIKYEIISYLKASQCILFILSFEGQESLLQKISGLHYCF